MPHSANSKGLGSNLFWIQHCSQCWHSNYAHACHSIYCVGVLSPDLALHPAQILRALSSRLPMEEGVDLAAIAAACDGFSGADLGALLSDAQLAAVHEVLAQPQEPSQVRCVLGTCSHAQPCPCLPLVGVYVVFSSFFPFTCTSGRLERCAMAISWQAHPCPYIQ